MGLIHSSAFADDEEKKTNRRKSIALIQGHDNGKEVFLKAMIPNLYAEASREELAKDLETHLTIAMQTPSEHLVAYYQAMIDRKDRTNVLKTMRAPVLFIIGEEDKAVPFELSMKQSSLPLRSRVELFEKTGHTSMNEKPQKLTHALLTFAYDVLELQLT
jgi:pimeloyl-ACP methyl ester carboxylesterase